MKKYYYILIINLILFNSYEINKETTDYKYIYSIIIFYDSIYIILNNIHSLYN